MPAKAPIYLKTSGKGNSSTKNSRKLREILSTDMISPPLGDLRHTAHVGRGGNDDMFGDTSFLKNETTSQQRQVDHYPFGSHTLGRNKKTIATVNTDDSPVIQSASSLPQLSAVGVQHSDMESHGSSSEDAQEKNDYNIGEDSLGSTPTKVVIVEAPPKPRRLLSGTSVNASDEIENVAQTAPKDTDANASCVTKDIPNDGHSEEESWKFELDLGPPLLDEVMGLINQSSDGI